MCGLIGFAEFLMPYQLSQGDATSRDVACYGNLPITKFYWPSLHLRHTSAYAGLRTGRTPRGRDPHTLITDLQVPISETLSSGSATRCWPVGSSAPRPGHPPSSHKSPPWSKSIPLLFGYSCIKWSRYVLVLQEAFIICCKNATPPRSY